MYQVSEHLQKNYFLPLMCKPQYFSRLKGVVNPYNVLVGRKTKLD